MHLYRGDLGKLLPIAKKVSPFKSEAEEAG
jgi:hypothetical protein